MPVINPVEEPAVAMVGLPLAQRPPGDELNRVDVIPMQILVVPVIRPGSGFTVNDSVTVQPDGKVYVTVEVPGAKVVTRPAPPPRFNTVATVLL